MIVKMRDKVTLVLFLLEIYFLGVDSRSIVLRSDDDPGDDDMWEGSYLEQLKVAKGYDPYWQYILGMFGKMDPENNMDDVGWDEWEEEMEELEEQMMGMEPSESISDSKVIYVDGNMVRVNQTAGNAESEDGTKVTFLKETQDSAAGQSLYFEAVLTNNVGESRNYIIGNPEAIARRDQLNEVLQDNNPSSNVEQFHAEMGSKVRTTRDWDVKETTPMPEDVEVGAPEWGMGDWEEENEAATTPPAEPLWMEDSTDQDKMEEPWWEWLFGDPEEEGTTFDWTSDIPYTTEAFSYSTKVPVSTPTLSPWWQWLFSLKDGKTDAETTTEDWVTEELEPWTTPSSMADSRTDDVTTGSFWGWWEGNEDEEDTTVYPTADYSTSTFVPMDETTIARWWDWFRGEAASADSDQGKDYMIDPKGYIHYDQGKDDMIDPQGYIHEETDNTNQSENIAIHSEEVNQSEEVSGVNENMPSETTPPVEPPTPAPTPARDEWIQ